jgi:hypothetical protein
MRIGRLIIGAAVLSYGAWAVGGMGVSPVLGAEVARAAGQQPQRNKRVAVKLLGAKDVQYDRTPLSFGVPFADGEFSSDTLVRLVDADGRVSTSGRRPSLPTQTQPLAFWNKDRKFVKWLLVDTQAAPAKNGQGELYLEYPAGTSSTDVSPAEAPQPTEPLRLSQTAGEISVDTGQLRLKLRSSFPGQDRKLLLGCEVRTGEGWRSLLGEQGGMFAYMRDEHGNSYDSCSPGPAPRVVVEESGPLRACIRVEGHHATKQGKPFCPYILRIHLLAGSADLRIHHTFIFDQDPKKVALGAIGLMIPLDLGGDLRAAIGTQQGSRFVENGRLSILQADDRHYDLRQDGESVDQGEKAAGWASLGGNAGGAVAVVRHFWQEHPKGLAVGPKGIDVQIYPGSFKQPLRFTTPFSRPAYRPPVDVSRGFRDEEEFKRLLATHPDAPLRLKSLNIRSLEDARWVEAMIDKHAQGRTMTYNDTNTSNGLGAAKTTEILLRLAPEPISDEQAERLARQVQQPMVAVADPVHVCNSGALGHFRAAGDPQLAQVNKDLDDMFHMVAVEPVELGRLYGMFRFGNMVCAHSSATEWVYLLHRESNPEKALRYIGPYNNEAADQIWGVWGQFIRTGRRRDLLIAQGYSRSVADVGFVHAGPPENVGLMHYHNGHQWSGGLSPSHSNVTGLLADYYFTGNRRLLDVAREAADHVVRTQKPAGIISCNSRLHREFTGPLSILLDVYQATWDEKYRELAERSLNWLLRTVPAPGRFPSSVYTRGEHGDEAFVQPPCLPEVAWGNKYQMFEPALRLMPSKPLEDFLVAEADYWVWESPQDMLNYACTTVCFAYDLTGDVSYAAYAQNLMETNLRQYAQRMRSRERIVFNALWYSQFVPRLMRIVADAREKDPEGFAAAVEQWKQKRRAMPDRPFQPRPDGVWPVSLGRLSTDGH